MLHTNLPTKKVILLLLVFVIAIIFVGLYKSSIFESPSDVLQIIYNDKNTVYVSDTPVHVEIVDTHELRAQGLSNRESLGENEGMLFVFTGFNQKQFFWMKDMLIPIDIIWINDGKIVQINENVQPPEPGTLSSSLERYTTNSPVDYVLEVNAGFSNMHEFEIGDSVTVPEN